MSSFSISPTKLLTWQQCEYKYFLSYIEGWKPKEEPTKFAKGNYLHKGLEVFYGTKILGQEDPVAATKKFILNSFSDPRWSAMGQESLAHSGTLLSRYLDYASREDRDWEIIAVEQPFTSTFRTPGGNEFVITGIADVIAKHRSTGKFWTWDHKSTSRFWSPMELLTDIQQPLYVIGIRQALGLPINGILVNMLKTYEYKDWKKVEESQLFARTPGYRTDTEIRNIVANTGRIVDQIVARDPKGGNFPRHLDRHCDKFCDLSDICLSRLKGYGSANYHGDDSSPFTVKQVLEP